MLVHFLSRLTISEQPANKGKSRLRGGERGWGETKEKMAQNQFLWSACCLCGSPRNPLARAKEKPWRRFKKRAPEHLPQRSQSMFVFLFVCCEAEAPLSEIDCQGLKKLPQARLEKEKGIEPSTCCKIPAAVLHTKWPDNLSGDDSPDSMSRFFLQSCATNQSLNSSSYCSIPFPF